MTTIQQGIRQGYSLPQLFKLIFLPDFQNALENHQMGTKINGIFAQLDMQMIQLFLLDNLEGSCQYYKFNM